MIWFLFISGVRGAARDRSSLIINLVGLALGVTACLVIGRYIHFEWSFDRYHEKSDRTHLLYATDAATGTRRTVVPAPIGPDLSEMTPSVEMTVRLTTAWPRVTIRSEEHAAFESDFYFADPEFFDMFDVQFAHGTAEGALTDPFSVVLTEQAAGKYFGEQDPVGEVLTVNSDLRFTISGVMRNPPPNTHLGMSFLASMRTLQVIPGRDPSSYRMGAFTYVTLSPGADAAAIGPVMESMNENLPGAARMGDWELQPLHRMHLHPIPGAATIGEPGNLSHVRLFAVIGLLILGVAVINYATLATSRASGRAREIGIRKASGAERHHLILQFQAESVFTAMASVFAGFVLYELTLPFVNDLFDLSLLPVTSDGIWVLALTAGAVILGLTAGAYPSLFLSSLSPIRMLKGNSLGLPRHALIRLLVAIQFLVTLALLTSTFVMYRQIRFVQERDLGFEPDHLIAVSALHELANENPERFAELKRRLLGEAGIESVSIASAMPSSGRQGGGSVIRPDRPDEFFYVESFEADEDFVPTLGLTLIRGRNFDFDRAADRRSSVLINETAARELGQDRVVGQELTIRGGNQPSYEIIGVIEDFHHHSLHAPVAPTIIFPKPAATSGSYVAAVRVSTDDPEATVERTRRIWQTVFPEIPFDYFFADSRVEHAYRADRLLSRVLATFAFLGVVISCIGLFGLVSHTVDRRRREIGIRKVLGASTLDLAGLLGREYLALTLIGFAAGIPVVLFGMRGWLDDFAYRTELTWIPFAASLLVVVLVAGGTVALRTVRIALANPVDSLRSE